MANINELLARAAALRNETALNSISPERAGGIMYDTLLAMNELWLQQGAALVISKIYASVAAMEADTAPVSDLTGQPLRPGQIVVIASSDSDNGSVYRYDEPGEWSLVGTIGNITPVDSLDSDSTQLPLAAHQGKVLGEKIIQLNKDIFENLKEFNWSNGYVASPGGVINSSTTSQFCQPILFKAGEKIHYKTSGTYGMAVVSVADDTPLSVGSTNFVVATLINASVSGQNYVYEFENDTYIVVTVKKESYSVYAEATHEESVVERLGKLDDKLIKIHSFRATSESWADVPIGSIVYNTTSKKLRKKTGSSTYVDVPYIDGSIYTHDEELYLWNGSDLTPVFDALLYYDYIDNYAIQNGPAPSYEPKGVASLSGYGVSDFIDVSQYEVGDNILWAAGEVAGWPTVIFLSQYKEDKTSNNSDWYNSSQTREIPIREGTKYVRVSFKKDTDAFLKGPNGEILFKWTALMRVGGKLLPPANLLQIERLPEIYPMEAGYKKTQQQTDIEYVAKGAIPFRSGSTTTDGQKCKGVIYSETMEIDKRVGWDVSLLTYVTAVHNPHSLMYTEDISATRSRSAYGKVYHGDSNSGAYYGSVCNTFALLGCSPQIPYTTPQINGYNGGSIRANNLFDLVYDQSIRGLKLMDLVVMNGHVQVVTKLWRDGRNTNVLVQLSEEGGSFAANNAPLDADGFANLLSTYGYRVFRCKELYKNINYFPSPVVAVEDEHIDTFVYNDDICTIYGDYACIKEGDILHISYKKGSFTSMEIYKNDSLLETITLSEDDDEYDVDLSEKGYTYGLYKARLTNGTNNSAFTHWEIINIEMSLDENTLTFSSANGDPIYWDWNKQNGGSYRPVIITEEDVVRGTVDVSERSELYKYCLKVHVQGTYGRVAGMVLNNQ